MPPLPPPGWARALPRWDDGHVLNHWSAAVGCTRLTAIEMTQHPLMQSVVLSLSTIGQTAENLYAKTHSVCVQVTIQRVCMRAYAELFALGRCAHWPRGSSILVRVTCGSRVHHWLTSNRLIRAKTILLLCHHGLNHSRMHAVWAPTTLVWPPPRGHCIFRYAREDMRSCTSRAAD